MLARIQTEQISPLALLEAAHSIHSSLRLEVMIT